MAVFMLKGIKIVCGTRLMEVLKRRGINPGIKKRTKCYSCKQIRHLNRDCPNIKQGSSSLANVAQIDDSGSEENILCVSSSMYTNVWILESSCSYNMTPHEECFTAFW